MQRLRVFGGMLAAVSVVAMPCSTFPLVERSDKSSSVSRPGTPPPSIWRKMISLFRHSSRPNGIDSANSSSFDKAIDSPPSIDDFMLWFRDDKGISPLTEPIFDTFRRLAESCARRQCSKCCDITRDVVPRASPSLAVQQSAESDGDRRKYFYVSLCDVSVIWCVSFECPTKESLSHEEYIAGM